MFYFYFFARRRENWLAIRTHVFRRVEIAPSLGGTQYNPFCFVKSHPAYASITPLLSDWERQELTDLFHGDYQISDDTDISICEG
jgi:hypothetical protein